MAAGTVSRWRGARCSGQAGMINNIMGRTKLALVVVTAVCAAMTVNTGTCAFKQMTRGITVGSRFQCSIIY